MPNPSFHVEVKGADALKRVLQQLGPRATDSLKGALHRQHEVIMTEAKRRCPVDTGALRASGTVLPPEVKGTQVISEGGFGGPSVDYAVLVHEDLEAFHPNGQAKFYESAMLDAVPGIDDRLARDVEKDLRRAAR